MILSPLCSLVGDLHRAPFHNCRVLSHCPANHKYLSLLITGLQPDITCTCFYVEKVNQTPEVLPPLFPCCKTQVMFFMSYHCETERFILPTARWYSTAWLFCYVGVGLLLCTVIYIYCRKLWMQDVLSVILEQWFIFCVQTSVWSGYHQPSARHLCTGPLVCMLQ